MWPFKPNVSRLRARMDFEGLVRATRHGEGEVRTAALRLLEEVTEAEAAPALLRAAAVQGHAPVGQVARRALKRIAQTDGVDPLLAGLSQGDRKVRRVAAQLLAEFDDSRTVRSLCGALSDADPKTRRAAAKALGRIGDPSAGWVLGVRLIEDPNQAVRAAAIKSLTQIGQPAVDVLCSALDRAASADAVLVARALGTVGDARAVPHLRKALEGARADARTAIVEALVQIGTEGLKALVSPCLPDDEPLERAVMEALKRADVPAGGGAEAWLVVALREWGRAKELGQVAVAPLCAALGHRDAAIRLAAASVLDCVGLPDDPAVQARHVVAARKWDEAAAMGDLAVEALCFALGNGEPAVRHGAARALEQIGLPAEPGSAKWQKVWSELQDLDHRLEGCTCAVCGKKSHEWDGCKCVRCGAARGGFHTYVEGVCVVCGSEQCRSHSLREGKCTHCGHVFLAPLSREKRVAVSNVNPFLYELVIAEKEERRETWDGTVIGASGEPDPVLELLRALPVGDVRALRDSVLRGQEGDKAAARGDIAEAARQYKAATHANPYNAIALLSHGVALSKQGRTAEGVEWVERALAADPSSDRIRDNLNQMRADLHRPQATAAASADLPSGVGIDACGYCGCLIDPRKHAIRDSKLTRTLSKRLASVGVRVTHVRCPRCGAEGQCLQKG